MDSELELMIDNQLDQAMDALGDFQAFGEKLKNIEAISYYIDCLGAICLACEAEITRTERKKARLTV